MTCANVSQAAVATSVATTLVLTTVPGTVFSLVNLFGSSTAGISALLIACVVVAQSFNSSLMGGAVSLLATVVSLNRTAPLTTNSSALQLD
mmetsp:Transcript_79515/g.157536  ORF Transcript_79515/g.157536 Transcript_79515/m.157536 type:complete len:91 (+) Transcript_79515:1335-1607(+)